MKCAKCKDVDVVWSDNIIRTNPSGQIVYDFSIGYCPNCNTKYETDNLGTKGKPKDSELSIVAMILLCTLICSPIAVIVAFIDICTGKKTESHSKSIIIFICGLIFLGIVLMVIVYNLPFFIKNFYAIQ